MKTSVIFILTALVSAAAEPEWKPLFDGKSFAGWTAVSGAPVGAGWEIADGAIHRRAAAGDIVTSEEFADFELEFEWKVAPGANSGLKYRFREYPPVGRVGLEYQVIDSRHADSAAGRTSAAAIYQLVAPASGSRPVPAGGWNQARIMARGSRLEHWLNGQRVLSAEIGSPEWKAALATSKFRAAGNFGSQKGRILLQDHGDEVWFRNLRLRALPPDPVK